MANPNYDPDLPDGPDNDPGAPATMAESVDEWTRNVGAESPDQEWLLSNYDTWEKNPFYTGKPGRHPESDDYDYENEAPVEAYEPTETPTPKARTPRAPVPIDDEIPF